MLTDGLQHSRCPVSPKAVRVYCPARIDFDYAGKRPIIVHSSAHVMIICHGRGGRNPGVIPKIIDAKLSSQSFTEREERMPIR
jgi:hypothetical protein